MACRLLGPHDTTVCLDNDKSNFFKKHVGILTGPVALWAASLKESTFIGVIIVKSLTLEDDVLKTIIFSILVRLVLG